MPLTSTDLEGLEDEPEEWLIAENADDEAWAFEFRVSLARQHGMGRVACRLMKQPCAERVLLALNNSCRNIPAEQKAIEPEMLKILAETEGECGRGPIDRRVVD